MNAEVNLVIGPRVHMSNLAKRMWEATSTTDRGITGKLSDEPLVASNGIAHARVRKGEPAGHSDWVYSMADGRVTPGLLQAMSSCVRLVVVVDGENGIADAERRTMQIFRQICRAPSATLLVTNPLEDNELAELAAQEAGDLLSSLSDVRVVIAPSAADWSDEQLNAVAQEQAGPTDVGGLKWPPGLAIAHVYERVKMVQNRRESTAIPFGLVTAQALHVGDALTVIGGPIDGRSITVGALQHFGDAVSDAAQYMSVSALLEGGSRKDFSGALFLSSEEPLETVSSATYSVDWIEWAGISQKGVAAVSPLAACPVLAVRAEGDSQVVLDFEGVNVGHPLPVVLTDAAGQPLGMLQPLKHV